MTDNTQELDEILANLVNQVTANEQRLLNGNTTRKDTIDSDIKATMRAEKAITSLIKELVAEAIGEDEGLVEVHKRNLVVASQFNAVVKSRNSLRHKQRQALKNLLKELEEK